MLSHRSTSILTAEPEMVVACSSARTTSLSERRSKPRLSNATQDTAWPCSSLLGQRNNRRQRPGRAFERTNYRFDVLSDYGAFRDLQRHRMLTIEWQPLSPRHGYATPEAVRSAGVTDQYRAAMARSEALHNVLEEDFPESACYAVSLAYRIRYAMQFNARQATHMLELRTTPQGHEAYRRICQRMHTQIAEKAGHVALAEAMRFVNQDSDASLGRLAAEKAAEKRRRARDLG